MITCKILNRDFETKEKMFSALKENKDLLIAEKKSKIYKSFEDGKSTIKYRPFTASKLQDEKTKDLFTDDNYFYIAVNSTRILDSHDDLHIDGIWFKSVRERQKKNYLVLDHELKILSTIVKKEYVEMFTAVIPFSLLGKTYEGYTEVLFYKVPKNKVLKPEVKEWLESGDEIQASVRMKYIQIQLALNSEDKEDEKEKETFDKYFPIIANKEDFDVIDYFFVIKEAANVYESSLVLYGSNSATGVLNNENRIIEPSDDTQLENNKDTQIVEPSKSTNLLKFI